MPMPCSAETVGAVELIIHMVREPEARTCHHELSALRAWNGREYGPSKVSMVCMRPPQHGQGGGSDADAGSASSS